MPKAVPKEFREDVIRVYRDSGSSVAQVAKEFGISPSCLKRWVTIDAAGGPVWSAGIVPVGIYKGQNDASTERNKRIWWTKLGNMPGTLEIWVP
ncbi:transposase [Nocardioides ochotonae]|uniref:transposase n=1 Tax=Nocardioides ochotonae TaxID=2685869 RepID=UPI00140E4975|nr:transposase [Nocardioides ochotonae]